jgi:hypothetical protein
LSYELVSAAVGVDPEDIPPGVETRDYIYGLLKGEMLLAPSRNGYVAFVIERIVAAYGLAALGCFNSKPWEAPGNVVATLFAQEHIATVVAAIDDLFDRIKADPNRFLELDSSISCCAKHLLESAEQAEISLTPMIDDGDQIQSIFNLLRSFQDLCTRSDEQGRSVVFAQMC